jgi:hypothetical protein
MSKDWIFSFKIIWTRSYADWSRTHTFYICNFLLENESRLSRSTVLYYPITICAHFKETGGNSGLHINNWLHIWASMWKGGKGHITRLRIEELTKLLKMKHELDNWCVVIAIYDPHIRVFSPKFLKCCFETWIVHPGKCVEAAHTPAVGAVSISQLLKHVQVNQEAPGGHDSRHNDVHRPSAIKTCMHTINCSRNHISHGVTAINNTQAQMSKHTTSTPLEMPWITSGMNLYAISRPYPTKSGAL